MNVTDINCLNPIWTLPRSGFFQVSNILTALNLDTLYNEVRKLCCHWHSISVCVYTQRYSSPRGYCCHLRGRGKIIALFENGIKIAKLWWASKYEHWSTEDSNSACTQTVKEYFLSYTQSFLLRNMLNEISNDQNRDEGWIKIQYVDLPNDYAGSLLTDKNKCEVSRLTVKHDTSKQWQHVYEGAFIDCVQDRLSHCVRWI